MPDQRSDAPLTHARSWGPFLGYACRVSLRGPPDVFQSQVLSRLLAAPAELILDALPPLQPQTRFLEVGAGGGVVARALVERIAGLGRLVAVDDDLELAAALPAGPRRAARAVAGFPDLPFAAATFDVAIANLVLGDAVRDGPRLAELRRVLRPGGWLLATVVVRGSFEELFDLLGDGCADALLPHEAGALHAARAALPDEDALKDRFVDAGFSVAHVGVEERLLGLLAGAALVDDLLVREVLLPGLIGAPLADHALLALRSAADRHHSSGMPLKARTAIVTARIDRLRA